MGFDNPMVNAENDKVAANLQVKTPNILRNTKGNSRIQNTQSLWRKGQLFPKVLKGLSVRNPETVPPSLFR